MIHYQLRCTSTAEEHAFDGWYKDSAAFDTLVKAGLVDCPVCGGAAVSRALMAPAIPRKGRPARNAVVQAPSAEAPPAVPVDAPPAAAGPMPAQLRAMLQKLRAEVEKTCDYVGNDFADEARRMQCARRTPRIVMFALRLVDRPRRHKQPPESLEIAGDEIA